MMGEPTVNEILKINDYPEICFRSPDEFEKFLCKINRLKTYNHFPDVIGNDPFHRNKWDVYYMKCEKCKQVVDYLYFYGQFKKGIAKKKHWCRQCRFELQNNLKKKKINDKIISTYNNICGKQKNN